jgi:hypothetical protein
MNDIFVSPQTADRNDAVWKWFSGEVLEVISNFMAQLSQPTRESIVNDVCRHSIAPGWIEMS